MKEIVSEELVREYIEAAMRAAQTASERRAIIELRGTLEPYPQYKSSEIFPEVFLGEQPHKIPEKPRKFLIIGSGASGGTWLARLYSRIDRTHSWKAAIFQQLRLALCTKSSKYAKEVRALEQNAKLLIAAIAGYVAASAGVAVAVVAAFVASFLRLISLIGLSVFCQRFMTTSLYQPELAQASLEIPQTTPLALKSTARKKRKKRKKKNR